MQLFSRNKALVALSLGALVALGACGDDVTVPAPVSPAESVSISPSNANMNVGETLNFAVQITGGAASTTLASCTSSSATVATAAVNAGACRVTAVAAGNATITATTSTGKSAAAAVAVAAPAPAITGLTVSPSAAQVAVGQSVTLVPSATRANASVNVAYTYTSSAAAVATVSSTGVVTAVAPGVATITISATGTGTGLASASLSTATAITVSDRTPGLTTLQVSPATASLAIGGTQQVTATAQGPRASAATITYGTSAPAIATVSASGLITAVAAGTATITVTAQATQDGAFAASSLTGLITITVNPAAQIVINSITLPNGQAVAINNLAGQIQINAQLQPNGQNVSAVQAWVCNEGEAVAACATRAGSPAAQQTFGASGALAGTVQLAINSAEFATPNWTTGADATVQYTNGLKTVVVTAVTAGSSTASASNNLSSLNFNNVDGYTMRWTLPSNRANDAGGNTWYGGPGAAGTGSFTIVPVMYTPGRTINQVTVQLAETAAGANSCGASIINRTRPFSNTYGVQTRDTLTGAFNCEGVVSALAGQAPRVLASLDNNSAAGPTTVLPAAGANVGIFNGIGVTGAGTAFYQSLAYRATSTFAAADYEAPVITRLRVRGGGATSVDSGWVNASYAFLNVGTVATDSTYEIADGTGVGLFPAASRNTQFSVCNTPAVIPADAPVPCTSPVATGGLTATVASMTPTLGESSNLTNQAYFLVASETDRLGNRATSVPFTYTIPATATAPAVTVTRTDNGLATFGVDRTAPVALTIPNESATPDATNPALAGVRSGIDSIFSTGGFTYTTTGTDGATSIDATNARFAVRVSDDRSGFSSCTAAVSCPTTHADSARIGTFQITRRSAPAGLNAANTAVSDLLIDTTTATLRTTMSGTRPTPAGGVRQFSIPIHGAAGNRNTAGLTIGSGQEGYYTFTATLIDRAGNTTTLLPRSALIDNAAPSITSVQAPFSYTGGAAAALTVQATDNVEVMGAELRVRFTAGLQGSITFPRVGYMAATARTGLFQNPFAALTSNRMAYAIGNGQNFNGSVAMPIPFIQDLQFAAGGTVPQPGATAANKPDQIGARVMDAKALATPTGGTTPVVLPSASSAWTDVGITPVQVSNTTLRKNWGADEVVGAGAAAVTNPGSNIGQWTVYSTGNAGNATVEFRARAISSSLTTQPFSSVYLIVKRQNTSNSAVDGVNSGAYGNYEYRGTATYAGVVDEGGFRYFRYTASTGASLGALAQGNNTSYAAFSGLDSIRAIGVDASGNGIATDAAIPGTTTVPRVITGMTVSAVNIFAPTAAPLTTANWAAAGGWFGRSGSTLVTESATSIASDSRVFIGTDAALATARIYATLTLPAGVAPTAGGNTNVTCTSNTADVAVVTQGVAVLQSTAASNTVSQVFCDVRGVNPGSATITITAARAAEAPYAAATAANTSVTTTVFTGAANITALGALSSANLNGPGTWAAVPGATDGSKREIFTIGGMTGFSSATMTASYIVNRTTALGAASGRSVSASAVANQLTGGATITVTCNGTSVSNSETFTLEILGRATSLNGFSAPQRTTIAGTCQ